MKQLTCEMCGSTDLVKQDGIFVCQSCGTKYSVEEAKKMMVEGTVDVTGSTVKVDTSEKLKNLYEIARRAKKDNNSEQAAKYYDMILQEDPKSWEASFYSVYYSAMQCKIADIASAAQSVENSVKSTISLIAANVPAEEQYAALADITVYALPIASMLYSAAKNHYDGIDMQIRSKYFQEFCSRAGSSIGIMATVGNSIEQHFSSKKQIMKLAIQAWKQTISTEKSYMTYHRDKTAANKYIAFYAEKIAKYDPDAAKDQIKDSYKTRIADIDKQIATTDVTGGFKLNGLSMFFFIFAVIMIFLGNAARMTWATYFGIAEIALGVLLMFTTRTKPAALEQNKKIVENLKKERADLIEKLKAMSDNPDVK